MDKNSLISSVSKLGLPDEEAASEYAALQDRIASALYDRMISRPDLVKLIGDENLPMIKDNSKNMVRFMGSMFRNFDAEVLVETVSWVFHAYQSHGFNLTYWPSNLNAFAEIIEELMSESSSDQLVPLVSWIIVNIASISKLAESGGTAKPASP